MPATKSKRLHAVIVRDLETDVVHVFLGNQGLGALEFDSKGAAYWTNAVSAKTTKIEDAFARLDTPSGR